MRSEDRPSRRLEAERKPDGAGVARDRQPQSPAVSLGSWHLSGQQRYGHRHVLTRNEVPQTVVHPAAETAVRAALRCPAPVDGRLLDRRRVGAGGTEQDLHDGARLQPQAVDFEVLDRLAGHQRNRRVHQHDLLYRDPERLAEVGRSGGQPHPMLGMPEQGLNGESELVAGGLHAGEGEDHQRRHELAPAESDVVLPGVRQRGRQVVAGTQRPLLDGILHGGPRPNESSLDALQIVLDRDPPNDLPRSAAHRVSHDGHQERKANVEHPTTREIARRRRALAPDIHQAFDSFSRAVFADGALPEQTKQLIAVAVAHTTQCPWCIQGHTRLAHRSGATDAQVMEAIWVAAEMRAGAAYAHATLALEELERLDQK